jgi:hypothetical protein
MAAQIRVKPGVQPRLVHLMAGLANAASRVQGVGEAWVTSAMDSTHSTDSLHYALRAIDIRTHNLTDTQIVDLVAQLKLEFGRDADVIYEHAGTPNAHIHLEWDPK